MTSIAARRSIGVRAHHQRRSSGSSCSELTVSAVRSTLVEMVFTRSVYWSVLTMVPVVVDPELSRMAELAAPDRKALRYNRGGLESRQHLVTESRNSVADEDLQAELDRLKAENERLKAQRGRSVSLKVSEKGGVSVYGLGRFPVTLYKEQWTKLLGMTDEIRAFLEEHDSELKTKSDS